MNRYEYTWTANHGHNVLYFASQARVGPGFAPLAAKLPEQLKGAANRSPVKLHWNIPPARRKLKVSIAKQLTILGFY